jgi:hypothetical protein
MARDPFNDHFLHWEIIKLENKNYAIQSISSRDYLDGWDSRFLNDSTILLTDRPPQNDHTFNGKYLIWVWTLSLLKACQVEVSSMEEILSMLVDPMST